MSARLRNKQEKLEQIIAKLVEEAEKGKPIVVEGKKDAKALEELGVRGTVVTVKTSGKSFLQGAAEIEALGVNEAILLLDFDRRGKEGTKRLQLDLERARVKANVEFWRKLWGLLGREVQCVEGLPSYMATLQQKAT